MPGLENLTLKIEIFKSANSSKRETFRFIGFDFESSKFMRIFVTISFFAHWTCSLTSAVAFGGNAGECRSPTSFRVLERVSHYLFNASPQFKSNYDGITVLKQSANRAIILAKILS